MVEWDSETFHPVVIFPEPPKVLDLSGSQEYGIDGVKWTIGRYDEVRSIYTTDLFNGGRTVHVGLDLGGPVGTPVHSFFDGVVFAVGYNSKSGDYGHTLVTKHKINGNDIWALYGHLDEMTTNSWNPGDSIETGQLIGRFGSEEENGGWPPHVHFQLCLVEPKICDLPGVVSEKNHKISLKVFPDPRIILGEIY